MSVFKVKFNVDDVTASILVEANSLEAFRGGSSFLMKQVFIGSLADKTGMQQVVYRRSTQILLYPSTIQYVSIPTQYDVVEMDAGRVRP